MKNTNVRIIAHSFKSFHLNISVAPPRGALTVCCLFEGHSCREAWPSSVAPPLPASPTRSVELQGSPWPTWQWDQAGFAAWSPYGCFSLGQRRWARGRLLAHPGSRSEEKTGGSCRVFVCRGEQGYYTYEVYIYTYM